MLKRYADASAPIANWRAESGLVVMVTRSESGLRRFCPREIDVGRAADDDWRRWGGPAGRAAPATSPLCSAAAAASNDSLGWIDGFLQAALSGHRMAVMPNQGVSSTVICSERPRRLSAGRRRTVSLLLCSVIQNELLLTL